ncbi:MAG TPA: preprotein translocase subunit YajC [Thermoclostridium sp.]|nr:preprotein translocase subunit YajC [Clostridiaceae bacterium]HOQ75802.1 preprotein translocase subunit YajC [Thermoclostridium sp.]HPU45419.1 preprotein translocase subunit YajC [Thermoclostridium sp.]
MQFLLPFLAEAAADIDPNATGAELTGASSIWSLLIIVVPLILMYVILIVPQRRRDKKMRDLINSAIVGDEIVTIGGLCGKIVNIKDDEITFESSIERTKITIKKWGIKEVKKPIQS